MTLYDFAYIDDKIIGGIEKNLPNVAEIVRKIEKRATGKATSSISMSEAGGDQTRFGETGGLSRMSAEDQDNKPKKITTQ